GSRLKRWLRRWRGTGPVTVKRRTTLTVLGPNGPGPVPPGTEASVDTIDLARFRTSRPSARGRAPELGTPGAWAVPEAALWLDQRRDRLLGWLARGEAEGAHLGPADANGLAWSALALKVPHPSRPHRLTLKVNGGHPSALG